MPLIRYTGNDFRCKIGGKYFYRDRLKCTTTWGEPVSEKFINTYAEEIVKKQCVVYEPDNEKEILKKLAEDRAVAEDYRCRQERDRDLYRIHYVKTLAEFNRIVKPYKDDTEFVKEADIAEKKLKDRLNALKKEIQTISQVIKMKDPKAIAKFRNEQSNINIIDACNETIRTLIAEKQAEERLKKFTKLVEETSDPLALFEMEIPKDLDSLVAVRDKKIADFLASDESKAELKAFEKSIKDCKTTEELKSLEIPVVYPDLIDIKKVKMKELKGKK